jgi:hypothetical protein
LLAHRLAFAMMGENLDPLKEVDHINGDKTDNRWENLRQVSRHHNLTNCKVHRKGQFPGVRFSDGRWQFRIQKDKVRHYFGGFKTEKEAIAAYKQYRAELYAE